MSYHILHIFTHGAVLGKNRGSLTLLSPPPMKRIPIDDIKAVVVAARGVQISSSVFSAVLSQDGIFLHCDDNYQPTGWSLPLERTRDSTLLEAQIFASDFVKTQACQKILMQKIKNQAALLSSFDGTNPLRPLLLRNVPNEALAARIYFKKLFSMLRQDHPSRSNRHSGELNACLNYGYAVLSALVHRSLIIHGLLAQIGVLHRSRYRSYPLVYDLMEPLRAFVDQMLVDYMQKFPLSPIDGWARHVAVGLRETRIHHPRYSIRLVDAIDFYIRSYVRCLCSRKFSQIWIPELSNQPDGNNHEPNME